MGNIYEEEYPDMYDVVDELGIFDIDEYYCVPVSTLKYVLAKLGYRHGDGCMSDLDRDEWESVIAVACSQGYCGGHDCEIVAFVGDIELDELKTITKLVEEAINWIEKEYGHFYGDTSDNDAVVDYVKQRLKKQRLRQLRQLLQMVEQKLEKLRL